MDRETLIRETGGVLSLSPVGIQFVLFKGEKYNIEISRDYSDYDVSIYRVVEKKHFFSFLWKKYYKQPLEILGDSTWLTFFTTRDFAKSSEEEVVGKIVQALLKCYEFYKIREEASFKLQTLTKPVAEITSKIKDELNL